MKNILLVLITLISVTTFSQQWTELGPFFGKNKANKLIHSMGFVNAILVNPDNENEIIMGTNSSGIWRTTNKGIDWKCVTNKTDLIPGMGIQSFNVNPDNKNQILACAGNYTYNPDTYGGTILISNDKGISWKIFKPFDEMYKGNETKKIIYFDSKKIYVLTDREVYYSENNGESWISIFQLKTKNNYIKNKDQTMVDMEITENETIYVSSTHKWGSHANVWKTKDKGKTWSNLFQNKTLKGTDGKHILTVKIAKPIKNKIYISATDGKTILIYKSINQGNTFDLVDELKCNHQTGDAKASKFEMEISLLDTDKLYFGFIEFLSWDAKNRFKQLSPRGNISKEDHVDIRFMDINLRNGEEEIMMGNDGGISIYYSKKKKFKSLNGLFLPTLQIYKMGISQYEKNFKILVGTQDNGTWEYKNNEWNFIGGGDGGASWVSENGEKEINCMNHIVITREGKRQQSYSPYGRFSNWFLDFPVESRTDGNEVLFGSTKRGNAKGARLFIQPMKYKKHGGIEIKGLNRVGEIGLTELNKNLIYIAEGEPLDKNDNTPRLLKSNDYGNNFMDLTDSKVYSTDFSDTINLRDILSYKIITDIEIDPLDENIIYISLSGYMEPMYWNKKYEYYRILKSENAGETWNDITENLTPNPVHKIIKDKRYKNTIYCATDDGVYIRKEFSIPKWKKLGYNFPKNIAVSDLKINYCSDKLYVSTFGRGVWKIDLKTNPEDFIEYKIKKDTKFTKPKFQKRTIRIKRKKTLILTEEMNMAPNTKIILESRATLIVDSTIVKSSCNNGWGGIEIEKKRFLWLFKRKKGRVILKNGGKIE